MKRALTKIFVSLSLLVSFNVYAGSTSDPDVYVFEGGTSLIDLYNMSGTTNMNACDDCVSGWSPDFGFDFDIFGQTYRKAKMSTNGCVNFTGLNCQDYTPQPLPYRDKTLYPFWTDLIRGNANQTDGTHASKMRFKAFEDYVVFGWYYMREYYRNSSNSFEAILYANDTYEYRYRELDIIQHDVLIGEQNTSSDHKTYRFYDDNSGGHNTWDSYDASFGGNKLENGGSLKSATLEELCANNQLYSTSCSGYAAAYLAQQCGISALYNSACSGYAAAYLAQQCGISALYNSSCSGYATAYFNQQCGLSALYNTGCSGYAAAYFTQQCGINALYDTDCSGYALAYYTLQCSRDALYDSGCDGYWEEIAYQDSLVTINVTTSIDDSSMYGYDNDTVANSLGYDSDAEYYGYDNDNTSDDNGDGTDYYYDDGSYLYDDSTDQEFYAVDVTEFDQGQVDISYGTEVVVIDTGSTFVEENDYYYEDDETYGTDTDTNVEVYDTTEEVYWAVLDTNLDTYDTEVEINFPEETFLWDTEEDSFEEDIQIEYEDIEELEELFLDGDIEHESTEIAQVLLDDVDIFILQEETGIELLREEDWEPEEELDLYEETLEDFERDALEELAEEKEEEFIEEIDEETLDELVDEEDLEDELEEEFFEEAEEKEEEVKEKRQSRGSRAIARAKRGTPTNEYQTRNTSTNNNLVSSSSSNVSSSTNISNVIAAVSNSSGVSTSQVQQQIQQETGQQIVQETGQQETQQQQQSQGESSAYSGPNQEVQVQQITQDIVSNEYRTVNNSTNTVASSNNITNNNVDNGVSSNVVQNYSMDVSVTDFSTTNTFDNIGQVNVAAIEPIVDSAELEETVSIETTFADVSVEFEQTFNDALGAGQSIGQFLSNDTPSFTRFNVEPPTMEQSNTIAAVESLADRVGTEQAQANLQAQFESMEQTGGFGDQTVAVAFIGYAPGFSAYTDQTQLADRAGWYRDTGLPSPDVVDNNFSFYMMAGNADRKIAAMRR